MTTDLESDPCSPRCPGCTRVIVPDAKQFMIAGDRYAWTIPRGNTVQCLHCKVTIEVGCSIPGFFEDGDGYWWVDGIQPVNDIPGA